MENPLTYSYATGGWPYPGVVQQTATDPPPRSADPTKTVVAGGAWGGILEMSPHWSAAPWEAAFARYGYRLWDMMMGEGKVKGSFLTLMGSVLTDGITIRPAYRNRPLKAQDGTPQKTGATSSDEAKAAEIAEFCVRCVERMSETTPLEQIAEELFHGTIHGSMLGEDLLREVPRGIDKGRLVLDAIQVKPRGAWSWVVDRSGRPIGVEVIGLDGTAQRYRLDKFTIFQWGTRNGNPSGTHIFDAAYLPWNTKIQLYPRYYKFLHRFAEPSLIGTTGEKAQPRQPRDADGNPIPNVPPIPAVTDLALEMQKFQAGSILAVPYGSVIEALETHGTGEAFLQAFDYMDREIVFAILWQVRATLEAQHGSKADSETAVGIMANATVQGRRAMGRCLRQPLRLLIRLNFGDEAAELYTPVVDLGNLDDDDLIRLANAVAKLTESGFLAESQLPEIDRRLKLPVRMPGSPRVTSVPAQQGPEGAKGGKPAQANQGKKPEPKKP